MAKQVAQFEKITYEQFEKDFRNIFTWGDIVAFGLIPYRFTEPDSSAVAAVIQKIYNNIKLPKRGTKGSAGYDFFCPMSVKLKSGNTITIPTGIKCKINPDWVLKLYPRSGLGFKYRLQLDNSVGIIDSDYYNNISNEGHIMAKITNDSYEDKTAVLEKGKGFVQGIFVEYGITMDDKATSIRNGGFGSTSK